MVNRNDDITLAGSWAAQLDAWVREHGLRGYDPFDVKAHPVLRAAQGRWWLRKAASVALDAIPVLSRRLLRVEPTENPKAYALVALGRLRLYQLTQETRHLVGANDCLEWLAHHARTDGPGIAWGYPFDVSGQAIDRPANIPVGVVTSVAGEAFALAYQLTRDDQHLQMVRDVAEFFAHGLNRIDAGDGTFCYSYSSVDEWPVHNANLHAAAHLYRTANLTGETAWLDRARPALEYTLARQREDGSWPYGEYDASSGYEKGLLDTVDHHHTGFVLRSLHEIDQLEPSERIREAIRRGYEFYTKRLFTHGGIPRITTTATWPVNIHACAEAILCPIVLDALAPGGVRRASYVLRWTRRRMADRRTGLPYYRRYPLFANKLLCPRWGVGWMFYALCEYLWRMKSTTETQRHGEDGNERTIGRGT